MEYTCIFFGILFCAAGIVFAAGKGHVHLSAWKNMTREEKAKINIVPLCRNVGEVIFLSGIIFLARGLWEGCPQRLFTWAMIAWLIFAGWDVWHISKSSRYRNS